MSFEGSQKIGAISGALLMLTGVCADPAAGQQTPRFQSSVELTSIDVTVVDNHGQPVTDLKPSDFTVRVDGNARRVVSAEWVPLAMPPGAPKAAPFDGYTSNQNATGGRLILIVVDQPHIRFGNGAVLTRTVGEFLDRLEPSDRVAAVSLGTSGASTPLTSDREQVKRAIGLMNGENRDLDAQTTRGIAISEAIEIMNGFPPAIAAVASRECADIGGAQQGVCLATLQNGARTIVQAARASDAQTIAGLRALFEGMARIDAPKTLVLVSEGLPLIDQEPDLLELGSMAGAARTSVYVLQLDDRGDASLSRPMQAQVRDRQLETAGLDLLASASRGTLLKVTGTGSAQFAQITSELSGYYLVGLESERSDKDGKAHPINVAVGRRGSIVRSRRQLKALAGDLSRSRTPREEVVAALTSPLPVPSLPLRVATFSVREPEDAKTQIIIHAEVGDDYSSIEPVSVAYVIVDAKGRMVASQADDARLSPAMRGVPSALQFVSTERLDPGDYTLRLGAADGDRVGTVEHHVHAGLVGAGPVTLSDLIVGGPTSMDNRMQPAVGYRVAFGVLQGYLEAYGPSDDPPTVKYEIATALDAPILLEATAPATPAGRDRIVFSQMLDVRQLPAGAYVLRAIVSAHGDAVKTMTRPFTIVAPAVLMTSASLAGTATSPGDIYLPVADAFFARKFQREDAIAGDTLRAFRETVGAASKSAFDAGVASLSSGNYLKASESFKSAIRPDSDVTAPMAYLAATYALSGNDGPAAGAWQTALVDGSNFPQIYAWLGDTLIRSHDLAEARSVLEEAIAKWPADLRFAKPLALLYATFGQGREAVRTLERHLAVHLDDSETLSLGVEWIFRLHSAGAVAHTASDDVKIARGWADAYAKTKGPQVGLVKEWMQALEKGQP